MSLRPEQSLSLPRLGGNLTVVLFVLTLIGFVVESQLTQVRALFRSIDFCISPHLYSMCKVTFTFDNRFSFCASLTNKPIPLTDFRSQLHSPFVTCLRLPGASAISRPHHVCIFGVSPNGPISRPEDSVCPQRPEPPRYPPVAIPIFPLSSSDGLPDIRRYITRLALVHQRIAVSVSVDL